MHLAPVWRALTICLLVLSLMACGGSSTLSKPNITVDAGPDQQVTLPVERVWLSGVATIDTPHKFRSALWRQTSGPVELQLENAGNLNTSILNMDTPGQYQLSLTVTDFFDQTRTDNVTIEVSASNAAPVVQIQQKQRSAVQGTLVVVEASASDADGEQLALQWQITQAPAESEFALANTQQLSQTFLAPKIPGEYRFTLTATDTSEAQAQDEMILQVQSLEEVIAPQLDEITAQLYQKYQDLLANYAFSVEFSDHDYTWQGTAGYASLAEQTLMTPEQPFRIASITKTMVAYLAIKMIEAEHFALDTPLSELISDADMPVGYTVADLHVKDGVKSGGTITVRNLLDQSTGILDHVSYVMDPDSMDRLAMTAVLNPGSVEIPELFTPELILRSILDRGLTQNLASAPGEQFQYGNSNTDILGFVMEKVTGEPLHELLEQHVFGPLGMESSFMDLHDTARTITPVDHFYLIDETWYGTDLPAFLYGNHNIIELGLNSSFAWAGGGVVSTLSDMQKFLKAIDEYEAEGNLLLTDEWHNSRGVGSFMDTNFYALGKEGHMMEVGSNTYAFQGHGGAWGSTAYNVKPLNIRLVTWDSHASIPAGYEFTEQLITLLDTIGYQAALPE